MDIGEEVAPEASMMVDDARRYLEDTVSAQDATAIRSTTLCDLQNAARQIELNQKEVCNLRRLECFFASLEKFSIAARSVCDTAAMAWAWGPPKLMLEICSEKQAVLKELVSAYKRIGQAFAPPVNLKDEQATSSETQQLFAICYADLLDFHRRTYEVLRRHGWYSFSQTSWARLQPWIRIHLDDLNLCGRLLKTAQSSQNIGKTRDSRDRATKQLEQDEKVRKVSELQNAQFWLEASKLDQEEELDVLRNKSHEDSCDWIYDNRTIESWLRNGNDHRVLWLKGIPGSGKSVLCSKLIEKIQSSQTTKVLYVLCSDLLPESKQSRSALQALTWQLIQGQPHLCAAVQVDFINQGHQKSSKPKIRELLYLAISAYPSVRIIIDGLDECDLKQQEEILDEMIAVTKVDTGSSVCKVLISSQDVLKISRKLRNRTSIDLSRQQTAVRRAISSFVDAQVAQSPLFKDAGGLDASELERVRQTLVTKAGGMFLWVRLVMTMLEHTYTPGDLKKALEDLPEGLDQVYDKIFARFRLQLSQTNRDRASRIFQWLTCSPRYLKRYEIQDAIALDFDHPKIDCDKRGFEHIIELCKPLVESGSGETIRFVHVSVKEYLLKHQPLFRLEEARCNITFSCLAYLLNHGINLVAADFDDESRRVEIGQGIHGLCRYAVQNWTEHLLSYVSEKEVVQVDLRAKTLQALENLALALTKISPLPHSDFSQIRLDSRCDALSEQAVACTFVKSALVDQLPQRIAPAKSTSATVVEHPLTSIRRKYDEISMQLLQATSVPGLQERELESFKKTYGSDILICRTSKCPRGLQGFSSVQERDAHESTHQLRCPYTGCIYNRNGVASEKKLKDHIAASHPEESAPGPATPIKPFGEKRITTDSTLVESPAYGWKEAVLSSDVDEEDDGDDDDVFHNKLEHVARTDGFALRSTDWT
nr:hypothetical protein LTR18_009345 [Exophiala xenobiotica]